MWNIHRLCRSSFPADMFWAGSHCFGQRGGQRKKKVLIPFNSGDSETAHKISLSEVTGDFDHVQWNRTGFYDWRLYKGNVYVCARHVIVNTA